MNSGRSSLIPKYVAASGLALSLIACSGNGPTPLIPPTPATLNGNYVFSVSGSDPSDGDYVAAGIFAADGKGNITSGIADYNLGGGVDSMVKLTGTYTVASGVASVKLTDGGSVQDTFTVPVVLSGSAAISAFDGNGSGTLYNQVSGFSPAGAYFFSLKGEGAGTVSATGNFTSSATGAFTASSEAYTDGIDTMNYASPGGFLLPPVSNGRGQAAIGGNNFAYYPVTASQVVLIGLDDRALLSGTAQKP